MIELKHTAADLKPLHIGGVHIQIPLTLAPMAGQTNHPFRRLVRSIGGCGLVCTELISSQAMHYKNPRTQRYFDWTPDENPFAVQLYGSDPSMMAEAARIVADHGANIVDINMGCWVPKIAKQGAGAALLRDVCTATWVVEAVVKASPVPVTVKVRSGWDAEHLTAVEFARAAEKAGVAAIAVHARTAEQGFTGQANWDMIRQVKEAVCIPVIGNGDVLNAADARRMFAQTGCDAIMIGRGALGNPWVFQQIEHELRTGERLPEPTARDRAWAALQHAYLTLETTTLGERQAVFELRGQLSKYHLGTRGAAELRKRLVHVETISDIEAIFMPIAQGFEEAVTG